MKRDFSISAIRVFAILMIVFYHCLCYNLGAWPGFENDGSVYSPLEAAFIRNIAYVGLDAFVFIAGMLHLRIGITGKYDNIGHFVTNKASRLLIPYLAWAYTYFGYECFWFLEYAFQSKAWGKGHQINERLFDFVR